MLYERTFSETATSHFAHFTFVLHKNFKMLSMLAISLWYFVLLAVYSESGFIEAHDLPSRSCCSMLDASDPALLVKCLNASSVDQYVCELSHVKAQPSLTVTMVSRITPEVSSYGAYSRMVLNLYAEHRGYTLLPLWKDSSRADYPYHRKLVPLIDALQSEELYSDYVAWIDAGETHRHFYLLLVRHDSYYHFVSQNPQISFRWTLIFVSRTSQHSIHVLTFFCPKMSAPLRTLDS